jgi:hypothetical protein
MFYSIPSFLKVSVHHYSVLTKTAYNQTGSWLLAGLCTAYTAVPPYKLIKSLKEDEHKRLTVCEELRNKDTKIFNMHLHKLGRRGRRSYENLGLVSFRHRSV